MVVAHPARKYAVNEEFFDAWSREMAYVLGFILADGNIDYTTVRISLQKDDVEILEFIKSAMRSEHPIQFIIRKSNFNASEQCQLKITSRHMTDTLATYGIVPAKTGKEVMPDVPDEFLYDFLRGFFDGDGCIHLYRHNKNNKQYYKLMLYSASRQFMDDLYHRLGRIGSIYSYKLRSGSPMSQYVFGYKDSIKIRDKMYDNEPFGLTRKKIKFYALEDTIHADEHIFWTAEQDAYLMSNYYKMTCKKIGEHLNKSKSAVAGRYRRLTIGYA